MTVIESKVLIPAVTGFVAAVLALAAAFGLNLSQDQQTAILGVAVGAIVLLQAVLGYLAPHTPRPDLEAASGPLEARHGGFGSGVLPVGRNDHGYTLVEVALFILIVVIALAVAVRFL